MSVKRILKHSHLPVIALAFTVPLLSCGGGTTTLTPQPPSGPGSQCSGVPVAATGAPRSIYTVPAGATGAIAQCQAIAAYRAGKVIVAYNDASTIAAALGEAPWSDQGTADGAQFTYAPSVNNGAPLTKTVSISALPSTGCARTCRSSWTKPAETAPACRSRRWWINSMRRSRRAAAAAGIRRVW